MVLFHPWPHTHINFGDCTAAWARDGNLISDLFLMTYGGSVGDSELLPMGVAWKSCNLYMSPHSSLTSHLSSPLLSLAIPCHCIPHHACHNMPTPITTAYDFWTRFGARALRVRTRTAHRDGHLHFCASLCARTRARTRTARTHTARSTSSRNFLYTLPLPQKLLTCYHNQPVFCSGAIVCHRSTLRYY